MIDDAYCEGCNEPCEVKVNREDSIVYSDCCGDYVTEGRDGSLVTYADWIERMRPEEQGE